jgi:hypothetical protein
MGKHVAFDGIDIPIIPGATLTFAADIDTLRSGGRGMSIALDRDSDGQPERSVMVGGGHITEEDSRQVDFTPETPEYVELFRTEIIN